MKAIETKYKGCRFRSRLEARWAVFFDAMGIQWWYEYEGFELSFDVDKFDPKHNLLVGDERRRFKENLRFAEGWYLPDFYLPELNYWVEIKPEEPSVEEREKALLLSSGLKSVAWEKLAEVCQTTEMFPSRYKDPEATEEKVFHRLMQLGVFILYGNIPWPYPSQGNAIGYGVSPLISGADFEDDDVDHQQDAYWGFYGLCWHQCRLCLKVSMGVLGRAYCRACIDELQMHIEEMAHEGRSGTREEISEDLANEGIVRQVLNLEFFADGHETPQLQEAYTAARSKRFERRRHR